MFFTVGLSFFKVSNPTLDNGNDGVGVYDFTFISPKEDSVGEISRFLSCPCSGESSCPVGEWDRDSVHGRRTLGPPG